MIVEASREFQVKGVKRAFLLEEGDKPEIATEIANSAKKAGATFQTMSRGNEYVVIAHVLRPIQKGYPLVDLDLKPALRKLLRSVR